MADNVLIKDPEAKTGYRQTRLDGRKREKNTIEPLNRVADEYFNDLENSNQKFKSPVAQANVMVNKPLTPQTYDEFITQLGRHPTDEEYRGWIKPRILQRVKEYHDQKMDERSALDELMDEFGYEDMVNEAWYGHPKRSDVEVWKARRDSMKNQLGPEWFNLSDDTIQKIIDTFGFNRNGEW